MVEESTLQQVHDHKQKKMCGRSRPRKSGLAYLEAYSGVRPINTNLLELGSRKREKHQDLGGQLLREWDSLKNPLTESVQTLVVL